MNGRLKALRKALGLNQADFGARIGVTNPAISKLEKGERNFTDQMILAICREFRVNEDWLRTGNGGQNVMFENSDDTNIAAVASEFDLDTLSQIILKAYVNMDFKKRAAFNTFVQEISNVVMEQDEQDSEDQELALLHAKLEEQFIKEKRRKSQVSFVKESNAG